MKFNLNSFLIGISTALDLSEREIFHTNLFHSRRVAYISVRIAKELGLDDETCFDMVSLAIMHDNGLTEAALNNNLLNDDVDLKVLENIKEHCTIGERNIESFPFLTKPKNIILYHHEYFNGSGFFGEKGDGIPLLSRIMSLADDLDFKFDMTDTLLENKVQIKEFVQQGSNTLFDPEIVDVFMKISATTSFWMDMQETTIIQSLVDYLPDISIDADWSEIFKITNVFSSIIDSKSKFTYRHTSGLIEKVAKMSEYYGYDAEKSIKLKIAASLHDLGKLAVPNTILEKNGDLTPEDFDIIKIHTYFTHFTLRNIEAFHEIERWAYCHHEKLDGSGYPYGFSADELGFEERLMACLDIYQALTEDRPYRAGVGHNGTMEIMKKMVDKNYIDAKITEDINIVFK